MKKNTLRHSLLLLLTAAIWGFAFVAQSVGMDYVQPFTFTAARSLIGGIVLLPFIFIRAQKTGRTSEEKSASWKQALPGGIICGVLLCEFVHNGTTWHSYRTFYNGNIRFFCF